MIRHAPSQRGGAPALPSFGVLPTHFDAKRPNSAWYCRRREGRVLRVNHVIAYCPNASRGLSAIAEFLLSTVCIAYSDCVCHKGILLYVLYLIIDLPISRQQLWFELFNADNVSLAVCVPAFFASLYRSTPRWYRNRLFLLKHVFGPGILPNLNRSG